MTECCNHVLKEFALARMLVAPLVFVFDALALSLCCSCVFSQRAVAWTMMCFALSRNLFHGEQHVRNGIHFVGFSHVGYVRGICGLRGLRCCIIANLGTERDGIRMH